MRAFEFFEDVKCITYVDSMQIDVFTYVDSTKITKKVVNVQLNDVCGYAFVTYKLKS